MGFNIGQMILDLAGGILSLAQLTLEAVVLKELSVITGCASTRPIQQTHLSAFRLE